MTTAERLKIEIAREKAKIEANDKSIEDGEHRQSLRRKHGDRLFNRLITLENQLAREEALLEKKIGPCVEEIAHDGVTWRV